MYTREPPSPRRHNVLSDDDGVHNPGDLLVISWIDLLP